MNDQDDLDFIPEYSKKNENFPTFFQCMNKPTNILEYMKFNSEEYKHFKKQEKIKNDLRLLGLNKKYIDEIVQLSEYYLKKLKIKFSTISQIITYKIIKKYQLPISLIDFFAKFRFDKSKYLKYSNLINLSNVKLEENKSNVITLEEAEEYTYLQNLNEYLLYLIKQLIEIYKMKPGYFKVKNNDKLVDNYINEFCTRIKIQTNSSTDEYKYN